MRISIKFVPYISVLIPSIPPHPFPWHKNRDCINAQPLFYRFPRAVINYAFQALIITGIVQAYATLLLYITTLRDIAQTVFIVPIPKYSHLQLHALALVTELKKNSLAENS